MGLQRPKRFTKEEVQQAATDRPCRHCLLRRRFHMAEGKCAFESTVFEPLNKQEHFSFLYGGNVNSK